MPLLYIFTPYDPCGVIRCKKKMLDTKTLKLREKYGLQMQSDAMISKMEERRKWKNVRTKEGNNMYKKLNNELRRETDGAREDWWKSECNELEELDKGGRSDLCTRRLKF